MIDLADMHTHTIASGHGTSCTISDMAKAASARGLALLGITDHGPATMAAGTSSYFRGIAGTSRMRFGVRVCCGVEANIISYDGRLDLDDEILEKLDYAIVSVHFQNLKPAGEVADTQAYICAMRHPKVRILGHPDDVRYPLDYEALADAAAANGVIFELNNASLTPGGYRGDTREADVRILRACRRRNLPILLASDSHGTAHIGDFAFARKLLQEMDFPEELVLNGRPAAVLGQLGIGPLDPKKPLYHRG